MKRNLVQSVVFVALSFIASVVSATQLNENCVVSVLNRTAQVRTDGTWILPNLPANTGLVRARATCVENGITRIGESDYFSIPTNGGAFTNDFVFETIAPTPVSLSLTAPSTTIGRGATLQLSAIATYSGGSTADVTLASKGTSYASTNPNVVSVSPDGVVTGLASGAVIISASNEATLAMLRVSVEAVSDSDGDGMPDDYELANGLNPNDPTDATKDADSDGLTNIDEYQRGTSPRAYDSDGDGIGDGLEVSTGTNPLDRSSFDLSRTLQSMSVAPNPVNVFINNLLGGGSAFVKVSGVLTDGMAIDLTPRARGTSYAIDNIAIATVGSGDGQVVGANNGNATLTVRNGAFTATASIVVSSFKPSFIKSIPISYSGYEPTISGNFLYVPADTDGFYIYDITNRANPQLASHVAVGLQLRDIRVSGTFAYVYDPGLARLYKYDVSVPSAPVQVASKALSASGFRIAMIGDYLYLPGATGLDVVKASDLTTIATVQSCCVRSVDGDPTGTTAAFVTDQGYFGTIDITNPAAPVVKAVVSAPNAEAVAVVGNFAYVGRRFNNCTIDVYDITVPSAPVLTGTATGLILGTLYTVKARSGLVFFAGSTSGLIGMVNVASPAAPAFSGLNTLSYGFSYFAVSTLAVDSQYIYAFGYNYNTGQRSLDVGRYVQVVDNAAVPPTVQIVAPANGATVVEGGVLSATVTATDDVEVDSIDLYLGARRFHSAKGHRADFTYNVPLGSAGTIALKAKSPDFGGNVGESSVITVNVVRDVTAPTVAIVSPASGTTLTGGNFVNISVSASDDSRSPAVELYRDGTLYARLTAPPYTFGMTVPTTAGSMTLTAKAIDASGNMNSATATYTIVVDQPPVVKILTPVTGDTFYSGAEIRVTVSAVDDVSVRYVEIFIDGKSATYTYSLPYDFTVILPTTTTTPHIIAKAADNRNQLGISPEVVLNTTPVSPLGAVIVPGATVGMAMGGTYGYVAAGKSGLQVIDASNPAAPVIVASLAQTPATLAIAVSGRYAFLGNADNTLTIVDVADPLHPTAIGAYPLRAKPTSLMIDLDRLYVATTAGVDTLDIRRPATPRAVSFIATPASARVVRKSGTRLYVLHDNEAQAATNCYPCVRLRIVNVADETAPATISSSLLVKSGYGDRTPALGIDVSRSLAVVSGDYDQFVVDISNEAAPRIVTSNGRYCCWAGSELIGSLSFAALGHYPYIGLTWTDITKTTLPITGRITFPFDFSGLIARPTSELIYAIGDTSGARPVNIDSPPVCRFAIGRWRTVTETAGTSPQSVITSPASGATYFEHDAVPIRVSALDDVAVASVTIFVDGQPVATQTVPPFDMLWEVPAGLGTHTITAAVTDFGGHTTTSSAVTINVVAQSVVAMPAR